MYKTPDLVGTNPSGSTPIKSLSVIPLSLPVMFSCPPQGLGLKGS